jgi:hypothetical protein
MLSSLFALRHFSFPFFASRYDTTTVTDRLCLELDD